MPNSLILQPGMSLGNGRYVVDRLIKQGRSSLTVQGTQVASGKSLIFKFPLQDQGLLSTHRQRFQHIWQRIGHFQHPYLPQTIDYLEEQGVPCLVCEHVLGTPLDQRLKAHGPVSEGSALRFMFQIAQGVQQLHDRGLIHGDIKPQNLILPRHGKAIVLVDWGLFWAGWNSQPLSSFSAPEPFMPPELRASLDVYSLAACLYTLVTGHPPISSAQQLTTPLVSPQVLIPSLTPMTQDAILQGMALNPDRRPNSVQAWLTLLPQPYSPAQLPDLQAVAPGSFTPDPQRQSETIPAKTAQTRVAVTDRPADRPPMPVKPGGAPITPSRSPQASFPQPSRRSPWQPLLTGLWVMTIAAGVGLTVGGFFRWQRTQNNFAQSLFQKEQAFPPQTWPGTLELDFPEDAPLPETDAAEDSYDPYSYYDAEPPVFQETEVFFPEPVVMPSEPVETEVQPSDDLSADPFAPLPNADSGAFEDPLYEEPEVSPELAPEPESAPETAPESLYSAPGTGRADLPNNE